MLRSLIFKCICTHTHTSEHTHTDKHTHPCTHIIFRTVKQIPNPKRFGPTSTSFSLGSREGEEENEEKEGEEGKKEEQSG